MAKYRQVHITFWQDPFIEELSPLQKYFYLYLMTNSKTTQCGCYEISMKLIKYETGLKEQQIYEFIKLLEENHKIAFNKINNEFLILNWLKHNSFKSPKVLSCIKKEINLIKTEVFKDSIEDILNGETPIDRLSKTIDTSPQQEQEEEREQEVNKKKKEKYLEFVLLTDEEHLKLVTEHGPSKVDAMIENLNNYIGSKGTKYKSHYHTLLSWERKNNTNVKKDKMDVIKENIQSGFISDFLNEEENDG